MEFQNNDHNVVSVSSGKDSTATWLLALEREVPNILPVFADTGNELPQVYEYLDYLEQKLGTSIRRIKADFTKEIERKRILVETKWPDQLMQKFTADEPGEWVLREGFIREVVKADNDENIIAYLVPPTGSRVPFPDIPAVPSDVYTVCVSGPFRWKPAKRGMTNDEAEQRTGEIVQTALGVLHPTGNPFLDMCLWKGRFPSTRARFCTDELKAIPIFDQVFNPMLKDPDINDIYSWQGVRADESATRAKYDEMQEVGPGLITYRPILKWTAQDVFDFHRKHGVKWNPLYEMGMNRVGCAPCVNCRKDELSEIAKRFPEVIDRMEEWERIVAQSSKLGISSFFYAGVDPSVNTKDMGQLASFGIRQAVDWSNTSRGGRLVDMFKLLPEPSGCSSSYGLCENPVNDNGKVFARSAG